MKDRKTQKEWHLVLLGLGLALFAVMALVMFFTVWPLAIYLMATTIPRWVLFCVILSLGTIIATILGLTFKTIAKKLSLTPESSSKKVEQNNS